ncbi:MAG: hypothetical protein FJ186_02345 [Gammaproteobacteria bacterium]|jgi:hypothetical protein|nr:hypothetical protein [Gammaproteobacteria bacterium]
MECFLRIKALRWQDWQSFFERECCELMMDCGGVSDIEFYQDPEDPSIYGYFLNCSDIDVLNHFLESDQFGDLMNMHGAIWDLMAVDIAQTKYN